MIPTVFIGSGDIATAKQHIGIGRRLLEKLRQDMSFQKLKTGRTQPFYLGNGVSIRCVINYGRSHVFIDCPVFADESETSRECFCFPHFAMGYIVAANTEALTGSARYERMVYDVEICAGTEYILVEGVYDANFGRYSTGQYVLVSVGAEMSGWASPLDCSRECLMEEPNFATLIITPMYLLGKMKQWSGEDDTEEEEEE